MPSSDYKVAVSGVGARKGATTDKRQSLRKTSTYLSREQRAPLGVREFRTDHQSRSLGSSDFERFPIVVSDFRCVFLSTKLAR